MFAFLILRAGMSAKQARRTPWPLALLLCRNAARFGPFGDASAAEEKPPDRTPTQKNNPPPPADLDPRAREMYERAGRLVLPGQR